MHNYAALSDHNFELLAASLLEAEFGGRWQAFARGRDGGVDVCQLKGKRAHIVQCKHSPSGTVAALNTAAKKEKKNLDKMRPKPLSYRFWTTRSLSKANKATLLGHLSPWIRKEEDIWGQEDIELALLRHPHVERAHVKLWIAGAGQLSAQVNGAIWERSRQLAVDIDDALPRYVETGVLEGAISQLDRNRVLIVSGPPGVGKTTVARLLVAQAVVDGYQPIEISSDVSEGQQVIDAAKKQIFYYDDFLGSTFLSNRLDKNEDKRLAAFIRAVESSATTKFVMTTREYILRQAVEDYEELERAGVHLKRLVIQLSDYTRVERGRILYNHLYHSPFVGNEQLTQLKKDKAYLRVIDHPNYNPRLIEFVTMTDPDLRDGAPDDFVEYVLGTLDSPESVWRRPFEAQLDRVGRSLVMLLACVPAQLSESDVANLLSSATSTGLCGEVEPGDLEQVLKVLDDSFIAMDRGGPSGTALLIRLHNPSIADFVASLLVVERSRRCAVISSAIYFEQITWLFQNLDRRISPDDRPEFIELICDALIRTFNSPSPRLTRAQTWKSAPASWVHADPVEQLLAVNEVMSASEAYEDRLGQAFDTWLEAQAQEWADDPSSFPEETCADVVGLMRAINRRTDLDLETWQRVVDLVSQLIPSTGKWSMLDELGGLAGADNRFLDSWREEFEGWFDRLLDADADEVVLADLEQARGYADELGYSVNADRYDQLHEEIAIRESDREQYEYDQWKDSRSYNEGDSELGAIFER